MHVGRQHPLERNLALLKWLSIDETFFCSAVVIAFEMHTVGLTLAQVLLGESVFALMFLLMDIPTSIFSDLVHRKASFIFGEICLLLGVVTLGLSQSFIQIVLCQIVWGIGASTISGTDRAMLYDSLRGLGREQEHREILGHITAFSLIVIAVGQVLSGFIGYYAGLRFAVLLCVVVPLFKLALMAFLVEPVREEQNIQHRTLLKHVFSAIQWLISTKVLPVIMFADVFFCLAWKLMLQTYNPYMELIRVPLVFWGIAMACFNLLGAAVSRRAHLVQSKLGFALSFTTIFGIQIVSFLLMAAFHLPFLGVVFPALLWSLTPFEEIFYPDEMNRRTPSDRRATVLSIGSFCVQLLQMLSLPLLGFVGDRYGLPSLYLLIAGVVLVVGVMAGFGLRRALTSAAPVP